MSIVHLIDTIAEWAQVNICDHVKLKRPPKDLNAADDEGLDYQLLAPAVFPMYVPTSEKLPPNIHAPIPALCVNFATGQDDLAGGDGFVDIQFSFSCWDPGTHGKDVFNPNSDGSYDNMTAEEAKRYFQRNAEGWRDAWNFVDTALRAVESVTHIGGYVIDRVTPIRYGPLAEQESIPDFYPYWFTWLSFRVNYPLVRNIPDIQNFL